MFHIPALTNDIYITRDKPMIVYRKRIEELLFEKNFETVILYAAGAAINTAVKLYLYSTKYLGVKKWKPDQILTYSVPVKNDADEPSLNQVLKEYSEEQRQKEQDNIEHKIISAIAIKLVRGTFDSKISKEIQESIK